MSLNHYFFRCRYNATTDIIHPKIINNNSYIICLPEAPAVVLPLVRPNGDTLGGEHLVEEEDFGGSNSGKETPQGLAPVELAN